MMLFHLAWPFTLMDSHTWVFSSPGSGGIMGPNSFLDLSIRGWASSARRLARHRWLAGFIALSCLASCACGCHRRGCNTPIPRRNIHRQRTFPHQPVLSRIATQSGAYVRTRKSNYTNIRIVFGLSTFFAPTTALICTRIEHF